MLNLTFWLDIWLKIAIINACNDLWIYSRWGSCARLIFLFWSKWFWGFPTVSHISECTFLLLPCLLPTRQSSKIIICIYITRTKSQNYSCCDQCNYPYVTSLLSICYFPSAICLVVFMYTPITSYLLFSFFQELRCFILLMKVKKQEKELIVL
jgi:hypothetical protein